MSVRSKTLVLFPLLTLLFVLSVQAMSAVKNSGLDPAVEYQINDTLVEEGDKKPSKTAAFESIYSVGNGYDVRARLGGKFTQQLSATARTNTLSNGGVSADTTTNVVDTDYFNDRAIFVRTTADFFIDFSYGQDGLPRIQFYDALRFRYKWAGAAEVEADQATVSIGDTTAAVSAGTLNKHVLWTREAWLKVMLGKLESSDDFLQLGLVPFSVGHGISLGSAYKSGGLLGFSPGFSIDQFAPGVLLRVDAFPKRIFVDAYFALLENKHDSFKSNNTVIRASEILEGGNQGKRGTASMVYLAALRSKMVPLKRGEHKKFEIEPYFVYQNAPDQTIDFANDTDSYLKSFGVAFALEWNRLKWDVDFGANQGYQNIKPWDRNEVKVVADNGALIQQYTKIYTTNLFETLATATTANAAAVAAAGRAAELNSKSIPVGLGTIWNAADRFRARQKKKFNGWFAVSEASYEISPSELSVVWGAGWSSGSLSAHVDTNTMTEQDLMNQNHAGFVPLQSVYSGRRLRHLVFIGAGIPRVAKKEPSSSTTGKNIVTSINSKAVTKGLTNLSFIGGSVEWNVKSLSKNKVLISPNVITYWSPECPLLKNGKQASPFLGTELCFELSAKFFDRLKVYNYSGVFLPGAQYSELFADGVSIGGSKIGDSPAYVFDVGVEFAF
jgi:hypothetical protein